MDVFSTLIKGPFEITIDNFVDATHKKEPYFQKDSKGKEKHYAICPECGNPIQIINLFGQEYEEQITKKRNTHARHTGKDIKDLSAHNQLKYLSCPLHKTNSFSCKKIRENEIYNSNLLSLIKNNTYKIIKDIREITGINFSKDYLKEIIQTYTNSGHYSYIHTHKFNIPYSILFTSGSLDLFGRFILSDNGISNEIERIINCSSNFKVKIIKDDKENISKKIAKTSSKYLHLILKFSHHNVEAKTLLLSILEYEDTVDNAITLGSTTITMKPFIYD